MVEDAEGYITKSVLGSVSDGFKKIREKLYTWRHLGWLILVVAALNVIFIGGKRRAFGIFIAALHTGYNETSMAELNWIGDSYASLGFFLMPFATTAIMRLNRPYRLTMFAAGVFIFVSCFTSAAVPSPGYLFLTHTLFHGIGSTLILCGTCLVTGEYFDKAHRFHVLATAFVSGGPYGVLIFGPLFSRWIDDYGWRVAFQFCGIIFAIVAWMGAITFKAKSLLPYDEVETATNQRYEKEDICIKNETADGNNTPQNLNLRKMPSATGGNGWAFCSLQHLKENPQIFFWAAERFVHNLVMYGLLMNLTAYVSHALGNAIVKGSRVNLYFGLGESIVFTIGAFLGDRIRGHLPLVYLIGAAFASLFLLIIQRTYTDINVVYVLAGFTGGSVGVGNTFLYATAEEVMLVHGSIAFPMTKMIAGVGMITAPLVSGTVIDTYNYSGFFISMAVLVCLRVVFLAVIYFLLRRKKKERDAKIKEELEKLKNEQSDDLLHCCKLTRQDCGIETLVLTGTTVKRASPAHSTGTPIIPSYQLTQDAEARVP